MRLHPYRAQLKGSHFKSPDLTKKNCYQVKKERRKLSLLSYIFEVFEKILTSQEEQLTFKVVI